MSNPDHYPKVIFGIFLLSSQNKNDSDLIDTHDRKKKKIPHVIRKWKNVSLTEISNFEVNKICCF